MTDAAPDTDPRRPARTTRRRSRGTQRPRTQGRPRPARRRRCRPPPRPAWSSARSSSTPAPSSPSSSLAVGYGAWELRRAIATKGITIPLVPLLLGTAGMLVSAYLRGAEALVVTFGLTIVGLLVWRVADGLAGAARDLSASALVSFYPVFLGGFASLMLAAPDGRQRIVVFILVTVFSDIGGYAVGVRLGKHPMAPSLSPKKSWEGFAGSVVHLRRRRRGVAAAAARRACGGRVRCSARSRPGRRPSATSSSRASSATSASRTWARCCPGTAA